MKASDPDGVFRNPAVRPILANLQDVPDDSEDKPAARELASTIRTGIAATAVGTSGGTRGPVTTAQAEVPAEAGPTVPNALIPPTSAPETPTAPVLPSPSPDQITHPPIDPNANPNNVNKEPAP